MKLIHILVNVLKGKRQQNKAVILFSLEQLKKLHLSNTIKRVQSQSSSDLIFDPVGYNEYSWIISKKKELFLSYLLDYLPKRQITYNMPKGEMSFRPVSYLNPVDSIAYQSVVDIIIRFKRGKFSNYVYSNIINDIDNNEVFHKPVLHWLEMRT